MSRIVWLAGICVLTGCGNLSQLLENFDTGALGDILNPTTVNLRLVNDTDFQVDPEVFVSSTSFLAEGFVLPVVSEELLTTGINRQSFDKLGSGETVSSSYDCDDIQAVMAKDAELQTGLLLSPEADSELFRMDQEFECGDTVTIQYAGGLSGFDVRISRSGLPDLSDLLAGLTPG